MITIESCDRCLTKYFMDRWKDEQGNALTKVLIQNEEMTSIEPGYPWTRISIDLFSFLVDSLGITGNRRMLREGIIAIQIFVPVMQRTKLINALTVKAISIFEGKKYEGVIFGNPRLDNSEEPADSIWYGKILKVPFEFTEIK